MERRGASEKDTEGLHCAQGLGRGAGLQAQGWVTGHSPGSAAWPQSSLLGPVPGPHFPWSQYLGRRCWARTLFQTGTSVSVPLPVPTLITVLRS